ncbi:retrovirus-related pol polyprotein from transposon TNT 1-94 [Tanacetum coccineum]
MSVLGCVLSNVLVCVLSDTMADVNVNAPAEQAPAMAPPTRTDEQILPRSRWVPVGKSNCYLDVERSQSNPIYKISMDILKHTNFFRAFIASSTIPSIYIQQFWDTVRYDKTTGSYNNAFSSPPTPGVLQITKDTLRDALQITLVDNNNAFSSPPTPGVLIKFVNNLGYPKVGLKDQGLQCYRFYGALSNEPILIMQRGCSPLHLRNEELVLGYLKFSAKGTKREVFGMPIPNNLITANIQGEQYYNAYLEKVAKHQRYLAGEEVSDPDSPAPKPAKATKPKATKQSKPLAPKAAPVTKPAAAKAPKTTASRPPKPTPATTEPSKKDQSKKRKLVKESSEAPSPAKRPKAGKVIKKRTQKSSRQLVDEFVDEGVPVNEPRFGDEEADLQKAVEESLKDVHAAHQGPLPPVVIREPEAGKFPPLSEVQEKGKEKVGHDESSSLYAELGLTDSETESDEEVPGIDAGDQDKGQAGPNPGRQDKGQAGSNPDDAVVFQPQPSHVVHAGPNLEHMDVEVTDTSIQQNPEQMDEEFTTTAYPNVQENLKLPTEDQFLEERSEEDEPEKTNTESEVQSMVTVPIHQDTSFVPLMITLVIDLTVSQPVSTKVSKAVDEIVTNAVDWAIQAPLRDRFRDLPEADMKEILHHRMWETKSYEAHEDHKKLYEALEKSMDRDHSKQILTDFAKARRKKKRIHESLKTPPGSPPHQPPPPLPPAGLSGTLGASGASGSS